LNNKISSYYFAHARLAKRFLRPFTALDNHIYGSFLQNFCKRRVAFASKEKDKKHEKENKTCSKLTKTQLT
jgi:uncharacterized membrane protein